MDDYIVLFCDFEIKKCMVKFDMMDKVIVILLLCLIEIYKNEMDEIVEEVLLNIRYVRIVEYIVGKLRI